MILLWSVYYGIHDDFEVFCIWHTYILCCGLYDVYPQWWCCGLYKASTMILLWSASTMISTRLSLEKRRYHCLANIARFARFCRQLASYKTSAARNLHPRLDAMLPRRSFILIAVLLADDQAGKDTRRRHFPVQGRGLWCGRYGRHRVRKRPLWRSFRGWLQMATTSGHGPLEKYRVSSNDLPIGTQWTLQKGRLFISTRDSPRYVCVTQSMKADYTLEMEPCAL